MITETEEKYVKDVYENIAERFNHTRAYKWKWVDRLCYPLIVVTYGHPPNRFYGIIDFVFYLLVKVVRDEW